MRFVSQVTQCPSCRLSYANLLRGKQPIERVRCVACAHKSDPFCRVLAGRTYFGFAVCEEIFEVL